MLLRTRGAPERSIAETKVVSTLSNELDDERLGLLGESTSTIHLNNDIAWCNINYEVGKKRILYDCYGHVPSGSLCAIIGASGSGKTSLLNVLAGRSATKTGAIVTGTVTVGGKQIDPVQFRQRIAYVMQEDAHLKTVTPREAFEFSARLRLPSKISNEEIKSIASRTIVELGLENCADSMVGGGLVKGISGGEKKRTSIGVEMITNPEILFVDEPTSGLDAFTAYSIVEQLSKVAHRGCAVLCTIHQPSSETFELFDSVILLKEGRVLYQGPRSAMVSYFAQFNYPCPNTYNPADFALFLSQRESADQFHKSGLYDSIKLQADMMTEQIVSSAGSVYNNTSKFSIKRQSTFLQQLYHLTKREILKVKRDKGALIAKFGITIFLNGLYGMIFLNVGAKGDGDADNLNAHFGVIMMVSISSMFGSAQPIMLALPVERPMFLREYATGTYTALAYFFSKTVVELPMTFVNTLLQYFIIYQLCSLNGNFLELVFASFALASTSCSIAVVLGSMVDDVKTASEIQPLIFTPQLLFAGYFIRTEMIPSFLRWSEYLCSLKYAISLILISEFNPGNTNCKGNNASNACQNILLRNGVAVEDQFFYIVILLGLFLGFRILAAFILVRRANRFY